MELIKNLILFSLLTLCVNELKAKPVENKCSNCLQVELTYNKLKEFVGIMEKSGKNNVVIIKQDKDTLLWKFTRIINTTK